MGRHLSSALLLLNGDEAEEAAAHAATTTQSEGLGSWPESELKRLCFFCDAVGGIGNGGLVLCADT